MDNKEFRFNAIDLIIILLLCVGIFALIYSILGNDIQEFFAPKYEVSYIFEVNNDIVEDLNVGDIIKTSSGKEIGSITSISSSTTTSSSYVALRVSAYEVDGMLFVNGIKLPDENFNYGMVSYDQGFKTNFKLISKTVLD